MAAAAARPGLESGRREVRGATEAPLAQRLPAPIERVSALLLGLRPGSSLPGHWRDPPSVELDIPPLPTPPTPPAALPSVGLPALPPSPSLPYRLAGAGEVPPLRAAPLLLERLCPRLGPQRGFSPGRSRPSQEPGQPHTHPPCPEVGESPARGGSRSGGSTGPAQREASGLWGQSLLLEAASSLRTAGWGHQARPGPRPGV